MSAYKLTNKTLAADRTLWGIFLVLAVVTVVTESEIAWLFIAGGLVNMFRRSPPAWLRKDGGNALVSAQAPALTGALSSIDLSLLGQIGLFFAKAGAFVFGSGLAIVPFLYGGVVTEHHWLNEKQFVDAVAVAMITPGPVVITVAFIALGTFLPCYLFTVLPAPYFKRYGRLPAVKAFVDGIAAAAIGAIAGSVIVIAKRSIVDWPTALLAVATVLLLWRFKKLQEPVMVATASLIGLAVFPLYHVYTH
jgi:chromate transporter